MAREVTEEELKQFALDHFEGVEFDYWLDRLTHINRRLLQLKSPKKRNYQLVDLYAVYLQLAEIAHITILVLTQRHKKIISNLFVSNKKLRDFIETDCRQQNCYEWFLSNYGLGSTNLQAQEDYNDIYRQNLNFLKEIAHDYLGSYHYLNAFKHGFRVKSTFGGAKVSFNNLQILEADTYLTYWYKVDDKDKNAEIIKEGRVVFDSERVLGLSFSLLMLLMNARQIYLATQGKNNKKVKLGWGYIKDKEGWSKSVGKATVNIDLFIIPKPKKHKGEATFENPRQE